MTDAIIGAAIALVVVAVLIVSGGFAAARRLRRWLQIEFNL